MLAIAMSWARLLPAVVLSTELAFGASQCEGFPKLSGTWFQGTQVRASIEREDKTPQTVNFTGNRNVTIDRFGALWYVFTQRSTDKILPNGRMEFQEDGRVVYIYQILRPNLWDKNPDTIDVFGLNRGYACVFLSETNPSELECTDVLVFQDTLRLKLRFAGGCTPVGLQGWAGISTDNFDVEIGLVKPVRVDYLELEMVQEPGPEFAYDENAVSDLLQGASWTSSADATVEEHVAGEDWGRPNWRRNYGNYRGYGRYSNYGNVRTSTSPAATTAASPESSTVPSSTTVTTSDGNVRTSTSPAATTAASPDSSTVPSSTTVTTSAVAADCECPTLPSFVRFQGGLEDVFAGSKNISGVHEIRQFHEDGTEAANGRILAIITTGDLDEGLPTQPQHMVCLCLPNYRIHCVNQMTNAWALGTFQGVEESTCTAQGFQLVGLFRDKFRSMFGPAVVDPVEAPGLDLLQSPEPPSSRLPLLSNFVCEWTGVSRAQPRLGQSSSFRGGGSYDILFREYYVEAQRTDQFKVPTEDGRYVVLQPLSDQKVLCAFADSHTFSCIHAVNCLSVHGTVEVAANFTMRGLQFLGNSGGFCLGQPVPIDYDRFLSDGESLQWMGKCTPEQEVTQFEFWVCTCAVDNPDTLLRPCDLDSIPIARSQALFVKECEAMSSNPGSCAQEFADLGEFQERPGNSYYGRFFVPTQANCELYRGVRNRWQNGSDNSATPASSAGFSVCPSVPDVARDLIISLLVSEPGGDPSGVELYALRDFQDETVRIVKNFGASFELSFNSVTKGSFFTVGFGNGTAFEEFFGFQPDFLAPFSFAIGRDILQVQGAGFGAEIWRPVDANNTALFQANQGFAARKAEAPQPYAPGFQQWSLARSVGSTVAAPWRSFCGTPAPEIPCPAVPDWTVPGLIFSLVVSDATGAVALELFAMVELRDHDPVLVKIDADGNFQFALLGEPRTIPQGTSITIAFSTSDSLQLIPGQKPDFQVDFDFNAANGDSLLLYDFVSGEYTDAWVWSLQGFASRRPGLLPDDALDVYWGRADGIGQYFVSSNLASVPWGSYCVTPPIPACPPAPNGTLPQTFSTTAKIVPGLIFSLMVLGPGSAAVELTALRDLTDPNQRFSVFVTNESGEICNGCLETLPASSKNMAAGDRVWLVFGGNPNATSLIDLTSPKFPDPPRGYLLNFAFEGKKGQRLYLFSTDDVEAVRWDRWGFPKTNRGEGEEWVFQGHAARKPGLVSDFYEGLTQWSITRDVYDFPRVPWDTYCVG